MRQVVPGHSGPVVQDLGDARRLGQPALSMWRASWAPRSRGDLPLGALDVIPEGAVLHCGHWGLHTELLSHSEWSLYEQPSLAILRSCRYVPVLRSDQVPVAIR